MNPDPTVLDGGRLRPRLIRPPDIFRIARPQLAGFAIFALNRFVHSADPLHLGFSRRGLRYCDNSCCFLDLLDPNKLPKQRPNGRPYAETRTSDIDGNYFDISEHGFLTVEPVGEKKPN